MTALICGSVAYDNIMVFEDSFKNHILPDKLHILNVAFLVPRFSGDDLKQFVHECTWVTVNDYEWQLLRDRTGWDVADVTAHVEALITTLGAKGSEIHTAETIYGIPAVKPKSVEDPTGCGDAYRAGLLYGLMNGFDWDTAGRVASLMGSTKIEQDGTQNHRFTREQFEERFKAAFGRNLH
jgi:adenosine kinase